MPRERSALKYHCVINHPEKTGITSKSLEALLRGIARKTVLMGTTART